MLDYKRQNLMMPCIIIAALKASLRVIMKRHIHQAIQLLTAAQSNTIVFN